MSHYKSSSQLYRLITCFILSASLSSQMALPLPAFAHDALRPSIEGTQSGLEEAFHPNPAGLEENASLAETKEIYERTRSLLYGGKLVGEFLGEERDRARRLIIEMDSRRNRFTGQLYPMTIPAYAELQKIIQDAEELERRFSQGERTPATLRRLAKVIVWYGLETGHIRTSRTVSGENLRAFVREYGLNLKSGIIPDGLKRSFQASIPYRLLKKVGQEHIDASPEAFEVAFLQIQETIRGLSRNGRNGRLATGTAKKEATPKTVADPAKKWKEVSLQAINAMIAEAPRGENQELELPRDWMTGIRISDLNRSTNRIWGKFTPSITLGQVRKRLAMSDVGLSINERDDGGFTLSIYSQKNPQGIPWIQEQMESIEIFLRGKQYRGLFAGLEENLAGEVEEVQGLRQQL